MKRSLDFRDRIKNFILQELSLETGIKDLMDDEPLLERGIIDSLGILHLLAFLEENYGLLLSTEELNPHNFATLQNIVDLVARKLSLSDK